MNLHTNIQRTVPEMETTTDVPTEAAAIAEAKDYDFRFISPGYFLCIHGENAYAISEYKKHIGCACEDMTYRCKPPRDVCKHCRIFAALQDYPSNPIDAGMEQLLKAAGWIGRKLHPPSGPKPARQPQPQAVTRAQKHDVYAGKSTDQIVEAMSDDEVRGNAAKGGVACVAEAKRRGLS